MSLGAAAMSMAAVFVRMGAPCSMIANECERARTYVRSLTATFGTDFIIIMTSCYLAVKGSLGTFIIQGQLP